MICNNTHYACDWLIEKLSDTFKRLEVYDIRVRVTNKLGEAMRLLESVTPLNIGKVWLD